jgi:hypothetical protein
MLLSDSDTVCYIIKMSLRCILNTWIETKVAITEISLNTQGLFFCKVGNSSHDVSSQTF